MGERNQDGGALEILALLKKTICISDSPQKLLRHLRATNNSAALYLTNHLDDIMNRRAGERKEESE